MKESIYGVNIRSLFSRNLKRLRGISSLSQMNLAEKAGLTHNFINDIENGKKWVSAETIARLADALKVEPYQFFISGSNWDYGETGILSVFLNDFRDSFEKMLNEYQGRYLPESIEGSNRI